VAEEEIPPRRWLPDRNLDCVGVRALEDEPSDPDVLARLLREHLQLVRIDASAPLAELVKHSLGRPGYTYRTS